jgi:hypothetical protein
MLDKCLFKGISYLYFLGTICHGDWVILKRILATIKKITGRHHSFGILNCCQFVCIFFRKNSCLIVQDLLKFAKTLEAKLNHRNALMKQLKPTFTLIGSVAEGTRIGLGNELDLTVEFEGMDEESFQIVESDPYHLTAAENVPAWMKKYVNDNEKFVHPAFMCDFLEAVDYCTNTIFLDLKNPLKLKRGTSNYAFNSQRSKCKECKQRTQSQSLFYQCPNCVVTVSQTKMGVCLQFLWYSTKGDKIYCSVDLVPTFKIKKLNALDLARIVNTEMIQKQPKGWLKYLEKYTTSDLIFTDLLDADDKSKLISSVLLKHLNCQPDMNYFIRPGQHLGVEKFQTKDHHSVYCWIKTVKKILAVDLSLYMLKKMLLRPTVCNLGRHEYFFYTIMAEAQIKQKFESKIDYDRWARREDNDYIRVPMRIPLK